jgi:hypothetical protein
MVPLRLVKQTYIPCIIANDAAKGDEARPCYTGTGENFQARAKFAVDWIENNLAQAETFWAFGAGTDEAHAAGPTLAQFCAKTLLALRPGSETLVSDDRKEFYGTYEEIVRVVDLTARRFQPRTVKFVFFTQKRHMWRVQLIWWLFFETEWGKATFVVTPQTFELSLVREVVAMGKVLGIYAGWVKARYETPYPTREAA